MRKLVELQEQGKLLKWLWLAYNRETYEATPTTPAPKPIAMHSMSEKRILGLAGLIAGGGILI